MRRRILLVLFPLVVLISGCVQLPQPLTTTTPEPRPAWTLKQAQTRRAEILKISGAAITAKQLDRAVAVLDGPERTSFVGDWQLRRTFGVKPESQSWRNGTVTQVWSSTKSAYPQTAYVLVKPKDPKTDPFVEVYTRRSTTTPWLRTATAVVDGPVTWPANGAVVKPAAAKINNFNTRTVSQLIRALDHPTRANSAAFVQNKIFTYTKTYVAEQRKQDGVKEVAAAHALANEAWSIPTKDGALVIAPVRLTLSEQMKDGWHTTYGGEGKKTFPGEYTRSSDEYLITYTLNVPARGKITMIGEHWEETHFTAF